MVSRKTFVLLALAGLLCAAIADEVPRFVDEGDDVIPVPPRPRHPRPHGDGHLRKGKGHCKMPKMAISVGDSRPCIFLTENFDMYDTCKLDMSLLPGQDFSVLGEKSSLSFRAASPTQQFCSNDAQDTAVCECVGDECKTVAYGYTQTWKEIRPTWKKNSLTYEKKDNHRYEGVDGRGMSLTYHGDKKCGDGFYNYTINYMCDSEAFMNDEEDDEVRVSFTSVSSSEDGCSTVIEAKSSSACPLIGRRWMRAFWVHLVLSFLFWACCFAFCCNVCCMLPFILCCCTGRSRSRTHVRVVGVTPAAPRVTVAAHQPTPVTQTPTPYYAPLAQPLIPAKNGYAPMVNTGKM